MYAYTTAGPLAGGPGHDERPGLTLLYHLLSVFLVHSGIAGGSGTHDGDSGGRRILPLGARRIRDFWGFLAGWWNWCASFVLGGVYAVLFSDYLVFFFPSLMGWKHYLVSLALIALIAWIMSAASTWWARWRRSWSFSFCCRSR